MSGVTLPPKSLLVVRLGAMGDIIHTLPAVASLRSAFPDTRIGWVVEQRWTELLCAKNAPRSGPRTALRPLVDFVHVVDTKLWRKSLLARDTRRQIAAVLHEVRKEQYELAIDFQGALKSAILARSAGAKEILGMERPREALAHILYDRRVTTAGAHVVEQYRSLAEAAAGRSLSAGQAVFPRGDASEAVAQQKTTTSEDLALINPGAGWAAKQWPPERYGEVARTLAGDGLTALINFGPGEEELAKRVETASGGKARAASFSITKLIALTRSAKLFIGGDTGPLHLAAALNVPVVAIFGPTDPARNGPYGTTSIVLRHPASRNSLSHTSAPDPGLLNITTEEVIAAARKLMETARA